MKRRGGESSDESSSSDDEMVLAPGGSGSDTEIDFEFFDPKESDFHSVKQLLGTYIPIEATSNLSDLLCAQASVGTIIKAEETEALGFITVLNLFNRKDELSVSEIKKWVISKAPEHDKESVRNLFEKKVLKCGLLLQRRLVNLPLELVPELHKSLYEDIAWATENEIDQPHRDAFKFKQFLLLLEVSTEKPKGKKVKKSKTESLLFSNFEDEFYYDNAVLKFNLGSGAGNPNTRLLAVVVNESVLSQAHKSISDMLGNAYVRNH